ncbi:hypothetical protein BC332_23269 [Capsicum chinense]|nr:hypothetical protein BC332_23269 [Capsicum chinense]
MDNPLSFSLGITQLDATVEDIPLGFVLATFDEQDPDWAENRSKHRNDPVTMKKLRDKTASKSKKSTSKASKKKFNDFGQPRLPKGIEYRIDKFPPHPLHMDNKDELYVWVQGEILKFTMLEFIIITDLKCTDNIDDYMYISSSKSALMSSTIPPWKILIKAGFASPVSPDQPLKKRKIIMFEQDNQAVMDDDTSGRDHAVHHMSSLYSKTHRDTTDKGEIGVSEIQHHHHGEIDSDEIKNYINKCHEDYDKRSLNDMKVSRDEESYKQYIVEEQQLLDAIMAYEEECSDEELGNKNISDVEDLSDVNVTTKEDVNEVNLKNQESTDVIDVQVRQLQASKEKAPAKRETKKSRVLRSPYISKYGSGSKDAVDFDKEENLKKETDNHYQVNASRLGYRQLDFVVAHPQSKNWFYLMSERKTCWKNEHLDVIFYYLKKKSKIQLGDNYRYMMAIFFSKTYVEKTHTRYYPAKSAVELSMQQDYVESIVVAKNEDAIAKIIHKFCMPIGLPWYMVDEIYISINCDKEFYWVLAVIVLKERLVCMYDSLSSKRKKESPIEILKLAVMLPTYLSENGFYDKTQRTD